MAKIRKFKCSFLQVFLAPVEKLKSEANWPKDFWMTTFADAKRKNYAIHIS